MGGGRNPLPKKLGDLDSGPNSLYEIKHIILSHLSLVSLSVNCKICINNIMTICSYKFLYSVILRMDYENHFQSISEKCLLSLINISLCRSIRKWCDIVLNWTKYGDLKTTILKQYFHCDKNTKISLGWDVNSASQLKVLRFLKQQPCPLPFLSPFPSSSILFIIYFTCFFTCITYSFSLNGKFNSKNYMRISSEVHLLGGWLETVLPETIIMNMKWL